jgi:hypothetical protein
MNGTSNSYLRQHGDINGRGDHRLHSLLDEQDHEQCSQGNQRALLAEKLDNLRGLVKEIQQDNWIFVDPSADTGSSRVAMCIKSANWKSGRDQL